jgi:hypothetical protein
MSHFIEDILQDAGASEEIPVTTISEKVLGIVLQFCEAHSYENPGYTIPRPLPSANLADALPDEWKSDAGFISEYDIDTVCELINA